MCVVASQTLTLALTHRMVWPSIGDGMNSPLYSGRACSPEPTATTYGKTMLEVAHEEGEEAAGGGQFLTLSRDICTCIPFETRGASFLLLVQVPPTFEVALGRRGAHGMFQN